MPNSLNRQSSSDHPVTGAREIHLEIRTIRSEANTSLMVRVVITLISFLRCSGAGVEDRQNLKDPIFVLL